MKWTKPTIQAYHGTVMVGSLIMSAKSAAWMIRGCARLGYAVEAIVLMPSVFDKLVINDHEVM